MSWAEIHRQRLDQVEGIVFDWDGTLADSIATIVSCMQSAAVAIELAVPGDDAVRDIIGLGLAEAAQQLFPNVSIKQQQDLVEGYRQHYLRPENRQVMLFDGVRELLVELKNSGYLLSIATGKSRRGLDRALAETGLADFFVGTRTVDECFSKPHPQMLEELADIKGMAASRLLMVGDGLMDIEMASNAGVLPVAVSSGAGDERELLAAGAIGCLGSVSELGLSGGLLKSINSVTG
ncbi:MAG: HAD-IA family hydrolase [Immundisolibacteraceae bacterium]|nr:HAD-IA family hydrolase [Immundisolibacteraceae bacterium]